MSASSKRQFSKMSSAYLAFGVALITLMSIIGLSVFLRITELKVEGTSLYSALEVVENSGLSKGDSLFFLSEQTVSQNIREALPFVSGVQVTRILPDTVLIDITESSAIAKIAHAGKLYVIDSSGRVIADSSESATILQGIDIDGLIEIRGVDISDAIVGSQLKVDFLAEARLLNMQDILVALEREGMEKDVSYLDVSNNRNMHFSYLGLYRVILGERSFLRLKLEVLPSKVEEIAVWHPNTPGDINMINVTETSNEVTFRPTS